MPGSTSAPIAEGTTDWGARGWSLESGVTSVMGVTDKFIYMILKVFLVVSSLLLVLVGKCYKSSGCYMWLPRSGRYRPEVCSWSEAAIGQKRRNCV